MLVDCDLHVGYDSLRDLLPHLDGATAELVEQSGTNGLGMPSYPWYHPTGWLRGTPTTAAPPRRAPSSSARRSAGAATNVLDPFEVTYGILTPDEAAAFAILPEPAARGGAVPRIQRLAAERMARARAAAARPARRHAAASRGGGRRDPAARRARRDRRRLPSRRGANPVRQPGARPDLAGLRRARAPRRHPHPLRGRRHRRPGDRRRPAGLLHRVPRADGRWHARPPRVDPLSRHLRAIPAHPRHAHGRRPRRVRRTACGGSMPRGAAAAPRCPTASARPRNTCTTTSPGPRSRSKSRPDERHAGAGDRGPTTVRAPCASRATTRTGTSMTRVRRSSACPPSTATPLRTRTPLRFFGLPAPLPCTTP